MKFKRPLLAQSGRYVPLPIMSTIGDKADIQMDPKIFKNFVCPDLMRLGAHFQ
jgi:hypothetical protein